MHCRNESEPTPHSPQFPNVYPPKESLDVSSVNIPASSLMVPGYENDYVVLSSRSPSPAELGHVTSEDKFVLQLMIPCFSELWHFHCSNKYAA